MFNFAKNWAKSFGNGIQDICKASVSIFGTIRWLVRLKLSRNKSLFAYVQQPTLNKLSACFRLVMPVCFVFRFALLCSTEK